MEQTDKTVICQDDVTLEQRATQTVKMELTKNHQTFFYKAVCFLLSKHLLFKENFLIFFF